MAALKSSESKVRIKQGTSHDKSLCVEGQVSVWEHVHLCICTCEDQRSTPDSFLWNNILCL